MRSWTFVLAIAAGLFACQNNDLSSVLGGGGGSPTLAVTVGDSVGVPGFRPSMDTLPSSDTLYFVVDSGAADGPFNVVWDNGPLGTRGLPPNSGDLRAGQTYSLALAQEGYYSYHCTHHANMSGGVWVIQVVGGQRVRRP